MKRNKVLQVLVVVGIGAYMLASCKPEEKTTVVRAKTLVKGSWRLSLLATDLNGNGTRDADEVTGDVDTVSSVFTESGTLTVTTRKRTGTVNTRVMAYETVNEDKNIKTTVTDAGPDNGRVNYLFVEELKVNSMILKDTSTAPITWSFYVKQQ